MPTERRKRGSGFARLGLVAGACLTLWSESAGAASNAPSLPVTKRYAIIVANDKSLDPSVPPLEFADDDAARYAELFDAVAEHVEILAVLDPDLQRLYPEQAKRVRAPDRATLLDVLSQTFERIAADRRDGARVIFYFILIGHGDLGPGGEGSVALLDAPWSRSDLYQEVLARSPASINHVIIDACNSYFLVHRRGSSESADDEGPSHAETIHQYLDGESLARYPNTGVLLSTSRAKESHEWSGYGAGVFSHEVRSALVGAADANRDGLVDYGELHAFIAAANLHVADPRARVEMFVSPPAIDVQQPVVDLRSARFKTFLALPAGHPLRFFIEDDRGVRYADIHSSGDTTAVLGLVARPYYYVRTPARDRELRVPTAGQHLIQLHPEQLRPPAIAARGSVAEGFVRSLFEEPFGLEFCRGFVAAHGYAASVRTGDPWTPRQATWARGSDGAALRAEPSGSTLGWWLLGAGAMLGATSIAAAIVSANAEAEFEAHVTPDGHVSGLSRTEAEGIETRAQALAWLRNGLIGGAAAAALSGAAVLLFGGGDGASTTVALLPTSRGPFAFVEGRF